MPPFEIISMMLGLVLAVIGAGIYSGSERMGLRTFSCLILIIGGCLFIFGAVSEFVSNTRSNDARVESMEKIRQEHYVRQAEMEEMYPLKTKVTVGVHSGMVLGYNGTDSIKVLLDSSATIMIFPVSIVDKVDIRPSPVKE